MLAKGVFVTEYMKLGLMDYDVPDPSFNDVMALPLRTFRVQHFCGAVGFRHLPAVLPSNAHYTEIIPRTYELIKRGIYEPGRLMTHQYSTNQYLIFS